MKILAQKARSSLVRSLTTDKRRLLIKTGSKTLLFRFTLIALQVYALGGDPAAEDGGFSKNYLSGKLCQQE
jgi:hypothetical protein